jgi:hypothetical protein
MPGCPQHERRTVAVFVRNSGLPLAIHQNLRTCCIDW